MKAYLVCLLSVSFMFFSYDCQDLQIDPFSIAYVTIGESLTLTCNYTGNNTPVIIRWFLNTDTTGMMVSKATCNIIGTPGTTYEVSRYGINCFKLTITNITENDIDDVWGCTVDFTLGSSPNVSRTRIKAVPTTIPTTTPTTSDPCAKNGLAYGLAVGLCIAFLCIIYLLVIIIVIFKCISHRFWLFILLGFIIVVVLCIICIVIILVTGDQCPLKLGLGLGIGLGIAAVTCIIFILILVLVNKVIIINKDTLQSRRPDGEEVKITAIIYGIWISGVEWIRGQNPLPNSTNGEYTIVPYDSNKRETSLIIKNFSMAKIETYICRTKGRFGCSAQDSITIPHDKKKKKTGLLVIPNRIGTKDESETEHVLSKPFDPKERRPLPTLNEKDKPNHHPQPIPSETNDVKEQNLRGLSANFDDTQGLASEMPRPSKKLPPIQQQVQSTVQEEGTSEEPKKKKKNRKKKDKIDEGKSADEIAE